MGILISLATTGIQVLMQLMVILGKVLYKTGFWLFIVTYVILYNLMQIGILKYFLFLPDVVLIASFLFGVYVSVQGVMRFINDDSSLNLYSVLTGKSDTNSSYHSPIPEGFIFGKMKSSFIVKSENIDGHILTIGGAGSGKSSCIAIPTLLSWNNPVFAIDIKGELSQKAKCNEHKKDKIKVFNPDDTNSLGYDPFYILKENPLDRVQNSREIVFSLIPLPTNTKDPFWIQSAQNILTGSILYYSGLGLNFIETITEIQSTTLRNIINTILESSDNEAKLFITQYSSLDDKVLGGISGQLSNEIMVFATDRSIKNALSKDNNINPELLEKGFDIYINISEYKLDQWKNLITLMVSQFLKHFERRDENKELNNILFLLDEFARLGKIEPITNGLATLRSKKITIAILTQSLAQLDVIYGKETRQVIADNCSFKAILKATDADTQDYFSRLVGTYEKEKISQSTSRKGFDIDKTSGNSKTTEEKRIIKPEEFAYLETIVLLTPEKYMQVEKAPYYETDIFSNCINGIE